MLLVRSPLAILAVAMFAGMTASPAASVATQEKATQEKATQSRNAADEPPASCPVTRAPKPPFVPPAPYPAKTLAGSFYLGTTKLWVVVSTSPWHRLPPWDRGYRQKIVWWSEGYDWKADPQPALSITGRRLDAPASPLIVDDHANGSYRDDMQSFIMSGVNLPTTGCWEITGRLKGQELKFVVWVGK